MKCEDDELESNFFRIEYIFRCHNVMGSHWETQQVQGEFKVGFNGGVPFYSLSLWNNEFLLGQCGCLILIVTVIDAT